jgi:hypothetical protein
MSIDHDREQEHHYSTLALDLYWSSERAADAEIERHLETCARCSAYLEELDATSSAAPPWPPAERLHVGVMMGRTYSVFVRFRRGQRLTLKRSAPLEVALRFASAVRKERFHNPDDVFIVDDLTGETVSEPSSAPGGAAQADVDAPSASSVLQTNPGEHAEASALRTHEGRFQHSPTWASLRRGQQLTSDVERRLGQLTRLLGHLQRSKALGQEVDRALEENERLIEQVKRLREGLGAMEQNLEHASIRESSPGLGTPVPPPAPPAAANCEVEPPLLRRNQQARGKR